MSLELSLGRAQRGPCGACAHQHRSRLSGPFRSWHSAWTALALLALTATASLAATVEVRPLVSADDAEEAASGSVYLTSGDLEFVTDGSTLQIVGIRWPALAIPPGATITSAWVQFTADEVQSELTSLSMRAEAADNAAAFTLTARNVSTRALGAASVAWSPVAWNTVGQAGADQRTPELRDLIQAVVNRPGWLSGNAIALVFSGSGHRTAYAQDGGATRSPLLHVEYTSSGGPPPDLAPVASIDVTVAASPALTVNASGAGSTDTDATPIASYRFDWGDGTAATTVNAPTSSVTHTYAAAGTYAVTLLVTDTGGLVSAPALFNITLSSAPGDGTPVIVEQRTVASTDDAEESGGVVKTSSSDLEMVLDGSVTQVVGLRWPSLAIPNGATITAAWVQFAARAAGSGAAQLNFRAQASDQANAFAVTTSNVSSRPRTSAQVNWAPSAWALNEAGVAQRTPDLKTLVQEVVNRPGWVSGNALAMIVTGTGTRAAFSRDGSATLAPQLHVEYTGGGGGPPPDLAPVASINVTVAASPPLTVTASGAGSTDTDATPIASYRFDWGDGTAATTVTAPTSSATHTYAAAGTYAVTLLVTDTGGLVSAPASFNITLSSAPGAGTPVIVEQRPLASTDDAEEGTGGVVKTSSSDLEMVLDGSVTQVVGLRWPSLAIPRGATITAAWVQFAARSASSGAAQLNFRAQASDQANAFAVTTSNVSSRPRTSAQVNWAPSAWVVDAAGAAQRTPELKALVQEVVNRSGWASGNALAMIVTGTGTRVALSRDGDAARSPLLHVEYTGGGGPIPNSPPVARLTVTQVASPQRTVSASGAASTDTDANPIASYRFVWGDGTSATTVNAPTSSATHTYAAAGTYTVTLTATDTGGLTSAPVSSTITVTSTGGGSLAVYAGYYSTHHPDSPQPKPNPWKGSTGVVFVGTSDDPSGGWDTSALRFDNLTASSITMTVTVDIGSDRFALWGSRTVPAGQKLILAQTGFENFDGSDTNPAGCYGCNPNLCLTQVRSTVPVVNVTIGGVTTRYYDTGQVLNTGGVDAAGCPPTSGRLDESQNWLPIFASSSAPAASNESSTIPGTTRAGELWFSRPYPNPVSDELTLRFHTATRGIVSLEIYDVAGRLVTSALDHDLEAGEYLKVVPVRSMMAGRYFARLRTSEGELRQSFVIAR